MIELSDTMKSTWITIMKSKDSAQPSDSVWSGLTRINQLVSDFVKEIYGQAAIEYNGRYYTPDCLILPDAVETAAEKRERIKRERGIHET